MSPTPFHYEPRNKRLAFDRWTLFVEPDGYREVRLEHMTRTLSLEEVPIRMESWEVNNFLHNPQFFGTAVRSKLLKELEKYNATGLKVISE